MVPILPTHFCCCCPRPPLITIYSFDLMDTFSRPDWHTRLLDHRACCCNNKTITTLCVGDCCSCNGMKYISCTTTHGHDKFKNYLSFLVVHHKFVQQQLCGEWPFKGVVHEPRFRLHMPQRQLWTELSPVCQPPWLQRQMLRTPCMDTLRK